MKINHLHTRAGKLEFRRQGHKAGFTLIELIVTIVVMGVVLLSVGVLSIELMRAIPYSRDLAIAQDFARIELAKVNNLILSNPGDASLAAGYDNTTVNYDSLGYPFGVRRTVASGPVANLKQAQVRVYPSADTSKSFLVNAITYIANIPFGAGSGGGAVGSLQAALMDTSGGAISGKYLNDVTLQNTAPASAITITQITISFTGGNNLKKVDIGGVNVFNGTAASGSTVTLAPSFTLDSATPSATMQLTFQNASLSTVDSLVFTMADASATGALSW